MKARKKTASFRSRRRIFIVPFLIASMLSVFFYNAYASQEDKSSDLETLINNGHTYYEQGEYELATVEYSKALQLDPENLEARRWLAYAYYGMGDLESAVEHQRIVVETDSTANAYYWLAILHHNLDNLKEAVGAYRKCLELDPAHKDARYYLISSLAELGDYKAVMIEISQLHETWREKTLLALSLFKYFALFIGMLTALLIISNVESLSRFFCVPAAKGRDFGKVFQSIAPIFAVVFILPFFLHNPFAPNFWEKVVASAYLQALATQSYSVFFVTYTIGLLIIPLYVMNKHQISLRGLLSLAPGGLKKIIYYIFVPFLFLFSVFVFLGIIVKLIFPEGLSAEWSRSNEVLRMFPSHMKWFGITAVPLFEEICFRGMLFILLKRYFKVSWSIIFSALFFALMHLGYPDPALGIIMRIIHVFIIGVVLAYQVHRTESLWPSISLHIIINSLFFLTLPYR